VTEAIEKRSGGQAEVYSHRLRGLVAVLPSDITGEIQAASEKIARPVRGFTDN
jgi:hypothetical protein